MTVCVLWLVIVKLRENVLICYEHYLLQYLGCLLFLYCGYFSVSIMVSSGIMYFEVCIIRLQAFILKCFIK